MLEHSKEITYCLIKVDYPGPNFGLTCWFHFRVNKRRKRHEPILFQLWFKEQSRLGALYTLVATNLRKRKFWIPERGESYGKPLNSILPRRWQFDFSYNDDGTEFREYWIHDFHTWRIDLFDIFKRISTENRGKIQQDYYKRNK